jgi:hypothetical protein
MITPTVTAANLDRCPFCRRRILTAFVYIAAVRGTDLVVTAHARCVELATSDLPADQLATAKAEHVAGLAGLETLILGASFARVAE